MRAKKKDDKKVEAKKRTPSDGYATWQDLVKDLEEKKIVEIETRNGFVAFDENGMTPGRARFNSMGTEKSPSRLYHFRDELMNRKYRYAEGKSNRLGGSTLGPGGMNQ